jgi:hypothetical protein
MMLSLSAFLATLPPAALAETDLPRFCALVVGRRQRAELPGVALLLAEEVLRGYPPALGAILATVVEQVMADDLPPELIDSATVESIFGRASFLERLGGRVDVRRERLRPGTLVGPELRVIAGHRLQSLGSFGPQLALIYPVDLARVPEGHFAVPRGPVLAMMVTPAESDALRDAWAAIEGATGLDGPVAEAWRARFFAIARRPALDLATVQKALVRMSAEMRARVVDALVAHCRDGELPEAHRPGPRGLERRLGQLGVEADAAWVEPASRLVAHVFAEAGTDPRVEAGWCPVTAEDLAAWSTWVEVPAAARDAVLALSLEVLEDTIMRLAEIEAGRVDADLDPTLRRGLQSLRDHCLRPRWTRSRGALESLDLLRLCDLRVARGEDLNAKLADLQRLAAEAEALSAAQQAEALRRVTAERRPASSPREGAVPEPARAPSTPLAASTPPAEAVHASSPSPSTKEAATQAASTSTSEAADRPAAEPRPSAPSAPDVEAPGARASKPSVSASASADGDAARAVATPAPAPRTAIQEPTPAPPGPPPALAPMAVPQGAGRAEAAPSGPPPRPSSRALTAPAPFELPPMPKPPPMRPRTGSSVGLPAPALVERPAAAQPGPDRAQHVAEPARPAPPRPAAPPEPARAVDVPSEPRVAPRPRTARADAGRSRAPTSPHLLTPGQAHAFYEESFRELELIERDILRDGFTSSLTARLEAIATDAAAMSNALGPGARSGDRDFQVAIERIERVESYVLRIRALELGARDVRPSRPKSLWRRLLGGRED